MEPSGEEAAKKRSPTFGLHLPSIGGNLISFVALTPQDFRASFALARVRNLYSGWNLFLSGFLLGGALGFIAFVALSLGSNYASQFLLEASGDRDRTGKAIPLLSPARAAVRVSNRGSEIEKDRRRAACTDS